MSINSLNKSGLSGAKNKSIREAREEPKLSNNQFEVTYLVVGGGGGGGWGGHGTDQRGGGGGGGGFRNCTPGEETGHPLTTAEWLSLTWGLSKLWLDHLVSSYP